MLAAVDDAVDRALLAVSRFNDRVQAALFRQDRLAPSYTEHDITDPFPFNAFYEEAKAPETRQRRIDRAVAKAGTVRR